MSFWPLIFNLNIFIIAATVPTGLQTGAKVGQIQTSGGGGTPWLQPKSNVTLKLASPQLFKLFSAGFGVKYFYYSGHCAHRIANLCKVLQMHLPGGGGTPWLQPKSKYTFKLSSTYLFEFLADGFEFKYFHYSGHCAHRIANLCKNAANAPFRGWGDTLDATQK